MDLVVNALFLKGSRENLSIILNKRSVKPYKDVYELPEFPLDFDHDASEVFKKVVKNDLSISFDEENVFQLDKRVKQGRDLRGERYSYPFVKYLNNIDCQPSIGEWVKVKEIKELAFDHGCILLEALGKFFYYMPGFEKAVAKINLPEIMGKANLSFEHESITFFGGTFNPWHNGHLACLNALLEAESPNSVLVIPDKNPWKVDSQFMGECRFKKYMELCQRLKNTPFAVYPGFFGKEDNNPTSSWITKVNIRRKNLLLGDDSFMDLPHWKNAKELIQALNCIYIVPRNTPINLLEKKIEQLAKEYPSLSLTLLPNHEFQDVSSTEIRKNFNI